MPGRAWVLGLVCLGIALPAAEAGALIDPGSPTTAWLALGYPTLQPDWSDDQRTGITEADIVGNTTDPAFYSQFDDAGTPSVTDGWLAFRVRMGADKNPAGFDHFIGVGMDADLDGDLDLFLGVDNSGNPDQVAIWSPGTDLNISPSTTSIVNPPLVSYAPDATNYDWSAVDAVIDPLASTFDVDADTNNDYFVSFVIPFQDIVNELTALGFAGFDQNTQVAYVLGSSTQPNALNQDLGGPNGETSSPQTWSQLGAMSDPVAPVPEPGVALLALLALGRLVRRRARS